MGRSVFTVGASATVSDWVSPRDGRVQQLTSLLSLLVPTGAPTATLTLKVREIDFPSQEYTVANFGLDIQADTTYGADDLAKMSAYAKAYEWQLQLSTGPASAIEFILRTA